MWLSYLYCSDCGHEEFDLHAIYVRTTANADYYKCPECGEETSNIDEQD